MWMSYEEAKEVLGVSVRQVQKFVREGVLRRNSDGLLREEEVYALSELRSRDLDLAEVAMMAKQAVLRVGMLERQLEALTSAFGILQTPPGTDEADILELYERAGYVLRPKSKDEEREPDSIEEIMYWASVFGFMSEEYLMSLEACTADPNSWRRLMTVGAKLSEGAGRAEKMKDIELRLAIGVLEMNRQNLRNAVILYLKVLGRDREVEELVSLPTIHEQIADLALVQS